jgi:alkanesulfonate monooxygenase SsuD/methylene tetrahydromethanopterin reductase-like flavin-dependent oxidoreductase (luciferase family)
LKVRVLMEPRHGATYDRVVAMAKATEDAGFDAFFRGDHYLGIDSTDLEYRPTDSWTTLAGVALETSRIKLGTLMTAGTFRHPGVVANAVATVDQMSDGRVVLGIGTGWYEREHKAFGIPFPPIGERFDRLDEEMQIIKGRERPRVCEEIGRDPSTLSMSATTQVICGSTQGEAEARLERLGDPGRRMLSRGTVGAVPTVVGALQDLKAAGAEVAYLHVFDIDDLDHLRLIGAEVLPQVA